MKISLKKLLFVVLTVFSVIFIGACGKSKIDKKEVIEKFIAASESMKSGDILVNMKMTQNGNKNTMNMTTNASLILDPLVMKLEMEVPLQNLKMTSFIKDNIMYIQNPADNQWYKQTLSDEIANQFKSYMNNSNEFYNAMRNNLDKIDIDEKDGSYIISISKDSDFLEEAMKSQLANSNTTVGQIGNDVKIENIVVKYIVDKNTYLTSSSTVSFDFEMQGMKISMEMDAEMSNINNVTAIDIPEEVLNAKEIPHQ
ncbi:putative lipoprotein [Fusobacterium sp. CM21]|uniref:DUF6612 family protein n=3 Tax=Fusobacterium vincentii TaxID=155615 RepID=A0AAJ1FM72_FUSVC|nr:MULTISPECIES: DUF6612 family protein [Fusobacterium]ETT02382.1 putative lipoprotein [Fusobacterium sp. CM21]EEO39927.1 hypothetical protein FSCG_00640 [Fusobacterium vincentii 4_1_13]EFG34375.1 hypothetical protein HMPREF0405_00647 [Fusobacterium vincentii 3_1_27]ERT45486.1 hypothetical protein HMPREF1768_01396 [Fusobacterium nucleatum CTI-7]MCW0263568.1 hypothetical protein [Fusobacterium vincentii]